MKQKMMWLLMGLCTLAFSACGSDDDNSNSTTGGGTTGSGVTLAQVVGTWELFHAKGYLTVDGVKSHDWDEDTDPDWLVIGSDGTWQYWEYSTTSSTRHQDGAGTFVIEGGVIQTSGTETLGITSISLNGGVMTVNFISTEVKSGKTYVDYEVQSWRKVK